MKKILLLNGPNLNLLGAREPEVYGTETLRAIERRLTELGKDLGAEVLCFQSNAEHELIERIHLAMRENVRFGITNLGAFSHTSVALRDALLAASLPFIELHISNVYARESFRQKSLFSDIAVGLIAGLGTIGYDFSLYAALAWLENQSKN